MIAVTPGMIQVPGGRGGAMERPPGAGLRAPDFHLIEVPSALMRKSNAEPGGQACHCESVSTEIHDQGMPRRGPSNRWLPVRWPPSRLGREGIPQRSVCGTSPRWPGERGFRRVISGH